MAPRAGASALVITPVSAAKTGTTDDDPGEGVMGSTHPNGFDRMSRRQKMRRGPTSGSQRCRAIHHCLGAGRDGPKPVKNAHRTIVHHR